MCMFNFAVETQPWPSVESSDPSWKRDGFLVAGAGRHLPNMAMFELERGGEEHVRKPWYLSFNHFNVNATVGRNPCFGSQRGRANG